MKDDNKSEALVYEISLDFSREPGMIPRGSDLKGFNEYLFYAGKIINEWPEGITFYFEGPRVDDYWVARLGWNVVSDKVKNVFHRNHIQGAQLLPVTLIHKTSGTSYPYLALNVFNVVYDVRRRYVQGLDIFRKRKIAREGAQPKIYISGRLKQLLEEADAVSGFGFRPVSDWRLDKD